MKKNKKKVYVVGNSKHYANFLSNYKLVDKYSDADIVLFTGGADVDPSLYNENTHPKTYSIRERDYYESEFFDMAVKDKKKMIGICRGSQLLTVLNGGKLIQDVNNHTGVIHDILFDDNEVHKITSTHHQMMYPYNLNKKDYRIIAWSKNILSTKHEDGNEMDVKRFVTNKSTSVCKICNKEVSYGSEDNHIKNNFKEPEIVYYPNSNSLAIQGHPEMMNKNSSVVIKINKLIEQLWH